MLSSFPYIICGQFYSRLELQATSYTKCLPVVRRRWWVLNATFILNLAVIKFKEVTKTPRLTLETVAELKSFKGQTDDSGEISKNSWIS